MSDVSIVEDIYFLWIAVLNDATWQFLSGTNIETWKKFRNLRNKQKSLQRRVRTCAFWLRVRNLRNKQNGNTLASSQMQGNKLYSNYLMYIL